MTDETPKVEPCGWCRKGAHVEEAVYDPRQSLYTCHKDCLNCWYMRLEEWNEHQRRILAARRKDFDAARLTDGRTTQYWKFDCFDEYLRGGE